MSKYKIYILGALLLIVGIAIGWISKPQINSSSTHTHNKHDDTNGLSSNSAEIWTCSMHPQIRQQEPGLCPICEMDLILLDNTGPINDDPTILMMSSEAAKLAQIETTVVGNNTSNTLSNMITVDGTIELDDRTIYAQSTHIEGRIEALLINFEGQYVNAGQKIATIYSTDLLAASQELITAAKFADKVSGIKDASIQKLKNWNVSDDQIEQILKSQKSIETIDIYADQSGYVLIKKSSLGDYVRRGQPLYTIGSTNRLWLIFNVYESDLSYIKKGQTISFTTPAFGSKEFTSKISYIDPLLDHNNRTAILRAEINNKMKLFKPGMLLTGKINISKLSQNKEQLSVPSSAVLWTGDKSVVYVKLPDSDVPSYQYREVTIGGQSNGMTTILDGIQSGEEIVSYGAFSIDAAAQLSNKVSMMNKNVTIKKESNRDVIPDYRTTTPKNFQTQIHNLVTSYLSLKDALVDTDVEGTTINASAFLQELAKVNMSLINGEAQAYWLEHYNLIKAHGDNIVQSNNIIEQRNQFGYVSNTLIEVVSAFGMTGQSLYVLHCPMAFSNEGADWLSNVKEVRNPYFGEKMMKCGFVKKDITPSTHK